MASTTTITRRTCLTALELDALQTRAQAAFRLLPSCDSVEERIDLLAAVVAPSHPLIGSRSSTSSGTGSS